MCVNFVNIHVKLQVTNNDDKHGTELYQSQQIIAQLQLELADSEVCDCE